MVGIAAKQPIVIQFEPPKHNRRQTFTVTQGDRYIKELFYEELLGLIASLTIEEDHDCAQWLKTDAEWRASKIQCGKYVRANGLDNEDDPPPTPDVS